ncbi:MAG TPA: hypothetical protein VFO29_06705 [Candidatus Rubrimentiphilum sp.]|nr:hypothetical protein [Candidatus Rubrimentiphilum sp.]
MPVAPVCLAFNEGLKFPAHPEPQIRAALRAVNIFVRAIGRLDDHDTRFSFDALSQRIFDERAAKRYDYRHFIVDMKWRVRVWRRVEYLDEKRPGIGRLSFATGPLVSHSVRFIQDTVAAPLL